MVLNFKLNIALLTGLIVSSAFFLPQKSFGKDKDIPKVKTQKIEIKDISNLIKVPALVKSNAHSIIKSPENLIFMRSLVRLGQKVKKGEKLIELKKQDELFGYQNRIIHAPIDGTIAKIYKFSGEFTNTNDNLIEIVDLKNIFVVANIPIKYQKSLDNLKDSIYIQKNSTKSYLYIDQVGSSTNFSTNSMQALFKFKNNNPDILIGSMHTLIIKEKNKDKITVPLESLIYVGNKVYVNTIDENKLVVRKEVVLGELIKDEREIIEGLKLGENLVISSPVYLKNGDKVEVTNPSSNKL